MLKILLENDEDLRSAHEMYKAFNSNDKLRRYALSREKAKMIENTSFIWPESKVLKKENL